MEWHDVLSLVLAAIGALWILGYRSYLARVGYGALTRLRAKTMHRKGLSNGWGRVGRVLYSAESYHGYGPMRIEVECPLDEPWPGYRFDHLCWMRLIVWHRHARPSIVFTFRARHELVQKEEVTEIKWTHFDPQLDIEEGTILPETDAGWPVIARDDAIPLGTRNSRELLGKIVEKRTGVISFSVIGFQGRTSEAGALNLDEFTSTPVQRYIDDWIGRAEEDENRLQSADAFPPLRSPGLYPKGARWIGYQFLWWVSWFASPTIRKHRREFGWGMDRGLFLRQNPELGCERYWWESTWWYGRVLQWQVERHIADRQKRK